MSSPKGVESVFLKESAFPAPHVRHIQKRHIRHIHKQTLQHMRHYEFVYKVGMTTI